MNTNLIKKKNKYSLASRDICNTDPKGNYFVSDRPPICPSESNDRDKKKTAHDSFANWTFYYNLFRPTLSRNAVVQCRRICLLFIFYSELIVE